MIRVPYELLASLLENEYEDENTVKFGRRTLHFVETEKTDEVPDGSDDLGIWCTLIFRIGKVFYRCWYQDGNSYWRANSGERWDPFHDIPRYCSENQDRYVKDGLVPCQIVVKKEVVSYVWQAVNAETL